MNETANAKIKFLLIRIFKNAKKSKWQSKAAILKFWNIEIAVF